MTEPRDGLGGVSERLRQAGVTVDGVPDADLERLVEALDRMVRMIGQAKVGNAEPAISYAMWLEENDERL